MTALGWGPGPSLIFGVICIMICSIFTQQASAAPVYEHETGLEALHEDMNSGCYYNFQHYDEGDRILTNEPCLNCTCHNRMLMCYLRVCPFTKAIGENCKIEKREDQCCPIITCPEVPVHLLTSTTTASPSAATDSTELGHLDDYGCTINELFYSDGARVPSDPSKPCELCYCIRNKTTCIMQECTLHVQGCKPVYQNGVCCPVRYDCDREEEDLLETTVSSGLLLTTTMSPGASTDCKYNSRVYSDGELMKTENACEHCYCMRGEIVCAVQECGKPMEKTGTNCVAIPREGQCCPEYECDNATFITTFSPSDELTTALTSDEVSTESKYPLESDAAPSVDKLNKADDSGIAETESIPSGEHTTQHTITDESSKIPEPVEEATEGIKPNIPQEISTSTDNYEHASATTESIEKLSDHDITTSPESDLVSVTISSQPSDEQKPDEVSDIIYSEDTTKYNLAETGGQNQILEEEQIGQEGETPKPETSSPGQSVTSHETNNEEIITRIYDDELKGTSVTESVNIEETPAPSFPKPEDELSPPEKDISSVTSEDSTRLAEDIITTEHSKPEIESLEPSTSGPLQESDIETIKPIAADSDKSPTTQQSIGESTSSPEIQPVVAEKDTEAEHGEDTHSTSNLEHTEHSTPSSELETEEHTENKHLEQQTTAEVGSEPIDTTEKVILTTEESKDILPGTVTEHSNADDSTSEKDTEHEQGLENADAVVPDIELPHTTESDELSSGSRKEIDEDKPVEVSTELGSEPIVDEQNITTEKAIEQENEVPEIPIDSQPETSQISVDDSEATEKPSYSEIESIEKQLTVGEQIETTISPLAGEEKEIETTEKVNLEHDEASEIPESIDHKEETSKEPTQGDEQQEISEKPDSELAPETTTKLYTEDNQLETSEKSVDIDDSQITEKPIDNSIQEQEPSVTEKESDIKPEISTESVISERFPDVHESESEKPTENNEITPYSTENPSEGSGQLETNEKPSENEESKPEISEKPVDTIENEIVSTDKYDTSDEQTIVTDKAPEGEHETEIPVGSDEQIDLSEKPVDTTENQSVTSEKPYFSNEQQGTEIPDERIHITEENLKPSDSEEQTTETEKPVDGERHIPETTERPIVSEEPAASDKPTDQQEQVLETTEKSGDGEEPLTIASEKPADIEEPIPAISEKPKDAQEILETPVESEAPSFETSETPIEDVDKVPEVTEKPADSEDKIYESTDKPEEGAEKLPEATEKSMESEGHVSETSEIPSDITEVVENEITEKTIPNEEQVPETEKPASIEDQALESSEKPTVEGAFDTSEKPIESEVQVPGITEEPIGSELLEAGVTDEPKEFEQTPSSEIDQTREDDSQATEKPPAERIDVQVPITEVPESYDDVTTNDIKPEIESEPSPESPIEHNINTSVAPGVEEQPLISEEKVTTESTEILKQTDSVSESTAGEDVTNTITVVDEKIPTQPEEEPQRTEAPIKVESQSPEVSTTENILLQSEHHAIPGEGDCLVDGVTYANNSIVEPTNPCQLSCKCISSIVQCEMIRCNPPPSDMVRCMPVFHGDDNCCPTYNCEGTEAKTPPSDSHTLEKLPEVVKSPIDVATEATPEQETIQESVPDVIVPVVPIEEEISTQIPEKDNNIPTTSSVDTEEGIPNEVSPSKDTPADESTSGLIDTPVDKTESPVPVEEVGSVTERFGPVAHEDASDVSNTTPKLDSITEKSDLSPEIEVSSEQPELATIKHEEPVEGTIESTTSEYPNEILPSTSHATLPEQENVIETSTSIPEYISSDNNGIDSNEIPSGETSTQPELSAPEISTEHPSVDVSTEIIKTPFESIPHDENEVIDTTNAEEIPSKKPEESYTTISSEETDIDSEKTTSYIPEISTEGAKIQETETEHFIIELGDISTQSNKGVESEEQSNALPLEPTSIPVEDEIPVTSNDVQESVTTEVSHSDPINHDENEIPTYENVPVQAITDKPLAEDDSKSTSHPISSSDSNEEVPDFTTSIPIDDTRAETLVPVETSTEYQEQEITVRIQPDYVTELPVQVEESDVTTINTKESDKPIKVTESNIVESEKPEASELPTEEPLVTVQPHSEEAEISTDAIQKATTLESVSESESSESDVGTPLPEIQTDKPTENEINTVVDEDTLSEHSTIKPLEENQDTEKPHDAIPEIESTTLAEDRIPHVPDNENELSPGEHISETSTTALLDELTTLTNEVISQTEISSQKPDFEHESSIADITTETNEIITDEPKDVQKPGEPLSVNEPTEKISETTAIPDILQESIEQSSEPTSNEIPIDNRINVSEQQTEQSIIEGVNVEQSSEKAIGEEHSETSTQPEVISTDQETHVQPEENITEEVQKSTSEYLEPTTVKTSVEESSEEKQETSSEEEQSIPETTENILIEISTEGQPIAPEQTTALASDNLQTDSTPKDKITESGLEIITEVTGGQTILELDTTTQAEVQKLDTSSEESSSETPTDNRINVPISEEIEKPETEQPEESGDMIGEPEPSLSVTDIPKVEEASTSLSGESLSGDITTKYPTEDEPATNLPVGQESTTPSEQPIISEQPSEEVIKDTIPEHSTLTSEKNFEPEVTEVTDAPIVTTIKQELTSTKDDNLEVTTISKLPELSTDAPQDNVSTEKSADENVTVHDISEGELKPIISTEDDKQTSDAPQDNVSTEKSADENVTVHDISEGELKPIVPIEDDKQTSDAPQDNVSTEKSADENVTVHDISEGALKPIISTEDDKQTSDAPQDNVSTEKSADENVTVHDISEGELKPIVPIEDDKQTSDAPQDNVSTEKSTDENVTVHDISEGELKPIVPIEDDKQTSDVPSISSQEPDYVQVPIEQSSEPSQEPLTSGPVFESSTILPSYSTPQSLNVTSPPRIPGEESQKPVKPDYQQPQHPDDFGQMPQQYPYPPETDDYDEDDSTAFGPGTCRYGGKVYVSAQQIPRDDPCDFCFCFRSDIICLQQSCPPPIPGCHEEPINGFCCPRYECPVSMATVLNVTTTTTTTTTTLPPHFLHHAYKGAASRRGCQIQGKAYQVGEVVKSKSGPCLHCTCGGDGQMKCDPKVCSPQPMIQQMIAAVATSRTGARR